MASFGQRVLKTTAFKISIGQIVKKKSMTSTKKISFFSPQAFFDKCLM